MDNQKKDLNKRSFNYGAQSIFIIVVVIAIIGVLNFLGSQYPKKIDLTKNKLHTFSDQSEKVMKSLKGDLTATFYGDVNSREQFRPVFDNYKKLSNHFKFELVDPNKEPTRAKTAGIKKMNTLMLGYEGKTAKVDDITEEKITNEVIKLTKDTRSIVCTIIGHGEFSFTDVTANGFSQAKKGLEDQSYVVKELTLPQETAIPADCNVLVMMGTSKAMFPAEIKMLTDYLNNGGRLVTGVDATVTTADQTKELKAILTSWGIDVKGGLLIDPVSKMLGVDASVPIIAQFNKEQVIVKDFSQQAYFPFARPVDVTNPAPEGVKTAWLGKTTVKSWAEMNMASIAKGTVQYDAGVDIQGPVSIAAAENVKRKDSKATHETRIVVFGTSQFANNQYNRFGGNPDLFLNSVSWAIEDESMISIRSKEDEAGRIELSQNQGVLIFWIAVVLAPLFIAILGIIIWVRRKKL
jgi:ABC-type uncharacterized transport system involved in gliding motility auxiliary subunit